MQSVVLKIKPNRREKSCKKKKLTQKKNEIKRKRSPDINTNTCALALMSSVKKHVVD